MAIADETPQEREERLERAEERLHRKHERLMESTPVKPKSSGGGVKGSSSVGSGFSDVAGFVMDHKVVFIILGIVVVLYFVITSQSSSSSAANTANQQGSLASAGYQDAGTAYALTQLQGSLDQLNQQLMQNPGPTGNGATSTSIVPVTPKGTPGFSNNFWVYTTKPGDTMQSIAEMAKWGNVSGGGANFLFNYRNNGDIFKGAGFAAPNPYAPLPQGIQISV